MKPQFVGHDLGAELVFDRFLGLADDLDALQALLGSLAPTWCSRLREWNGPRDQRPVDIGRDGALKAAVLAAAGRRGPTYAALVERHGAPPYERVTGSAELRGAGPELVVVVSIDEMVLSPLGPAKALGNHVALQVRRPGIEGQPGGQWLREAFEALSAELAPAWGYACHPDEYWAKVMSDAPSIRAVGRDFSRSLPGLFWLNFFGRRLRDSVGEDRLLSTPAHRVAAVDAGVAVELAADARSWSTPEYAGREALVREHLGADLFFSKAEPDRRAAMPDWT